MAICALVTKSLPLIAQSIAYNNVLHLSDTVTSAQVGVMYSSILYNDWFDRHLNDYTLVKMTGVVSMSAKIQTAISARRQFCKVQKVRDFIG